jgi:hypothetical protein
MILSDLSASVSCLERNFAYKGREEQLNFIDGRAAGIGRLREVGFSSSIITQGSLTLS